MKGQLNKNVIESQGWPRFNKDGVLSLECNSEITISCYDGQCGVLKFSDSNGTENLVFAAPLLVYAVGVHKEDCKVETDNRIANSSEPYVLVRGYRADTKECTYFNLSIFPAQGQTVEQLRDAIIALVCACNTVGSAEVTNGLQLIEAKIGLGGTLIQDTTIQGDGFSLIFGLVNEFVISSTRFQVEAVEDVSLEAGTTAQMEGRTGATVSSTEGDVNLQTGTDKIITGKDTYFYLGADAVEGSWRIGRSVNDLVFERYESGSWVTKDTITP